MQLAIDATSAKPATSSGATLQGFDATMVANVSNPNVIVSLPAFSDLVNNDLAEASGFGR